MSGQVFTWEGISLPSYWGGNWGSQTADAAFDGIRNTGASTVAIIPSFYMPDKWSNTMGIVEHQSESIEQTRAAMLDVTSRGMNVMLKPHVEVLAPENGATVWRAEIAPTNPDLWFQNYKAMMLQYGQLAQEMGAPLLCIGTEMMSMSGAAHRDRWVDLIDSIRAVYGGKITYAATYHEVNQVSFWDKVDYIGVNPYLPLSTVNDPTVQQMIDAWIQPHHNSWIRDELHGGRSAVEYYKFISEQYGKQILFTEVGYRSYDGANKDPGRWMGGSLDGVDYQEQVDAYQALFHVMTTYGGQWLDGAFLWSYHPFANYSDPDYPIDPWDYTTQNKPADALVTNFYSGPAHQAGLTLTGTSAANKLDGGYHNDSLTGGAGNDTLWGGAGHDVLNGGADDDTLTGKAGNDILDGGTGTNTAVFSGARANYTVTTNSDGSITVTDTRSGGDGTDTLHRVKHARFSDLTVDLQSSTETPNEPPSEPPTEPPSTETPDIPAVPQPSGFLEGTPGPDVLTGHDGNNLIIGLRGNDVLSGAGGMDTIFADYGNDRLLGGADKDYLFGSYGNDRLHGGTGDDLLWGEQGRDVLTGGKGRDIFAFDTKPNKRTNRDKITDFKAKDDSIWLENKIFKKLGKKGSEKKPAKLNKKFFTVGDKAKDKNDYLVYNKKKGVLSYDKDGSGGARPVDIATFKKNEKVTAADFFVI